MNKYYISPKDLYTVLTNRGIKSLFHANSVLTSLSFITEDALLSRSYIEGHNLTQTAQGSDAKDKSHNVWDDVFLDGLDLGKYYYRPNAYGPVLFVMSLDLLLDDTIDGVLITKNNPYYWSYDSSIDSKYFSSIEDVDIAYLSGDYHTHARIMFTFRSPGKKIQLSKYCEKIILDRCGFVTDTGKEIDKCVCGSIQRSLDLNGIDIPIEQRDVAYKFDVNNIVKLFRTKI